MVTLQEFTFASKANEYTISVQKWSILFSGYGHKQITFMVEIEHENQVDPSIIIKGKKKFFVTREDSYFEDLPEELTYQEYEQQLVEDNYYLIEDEVREWLKDMEEFTLEIAQQDEE